MLSVTAVAASGAGAGKKQSRQRAPGKFHGHQAGQAQQHDRRPPQPRERPHRGPSSMHAPTKSNTVVNSSRRRSDGASGSNCAGNACTLRSATSDMNAIANTSADARFAVSGITGRAASAPTARQQHRSAARPS